MCFQIKKLSEAGFKLKRVTIAMVKLKHIDNMHENQSTHDI
jgi:hypothetical protein